MNGPIGVQQPCSSPARRYTGRTHAPETFFPTRYTSKTWRWQCGTQETLRARIIQYICCLVDGGCALVAQEESSSIEEKKTHITHTTRACNSTLTLQRAWLHSKGNQNSPVNSQQQYFSGDSDLKKSILEQAIKRA